MLRSQPDGFEYRTPVTPIQGAQVSSTTENEKNYDTLKIVRNLLTEKVASLSKDFNLFDVLGPGTNQEKRDTMMRNIAGNQIAYDILVPLLEAVNSAMETVDNKYRER